MERLTKQNISSLSGFSVGKVKNYIKLFPEYFQEVEISGRKHPVYYPDSVEIVKIIASMIRKNDHEDIKTALNEAGYNPYYEYVDKSTAITANNTTATIELKSLIDIVDAQKQIIGYQKDVIQEQRQIINELQNKDESKE
jgi:hypothetical protein